MMPTATVHTHHAGCARPLFDVVSLPHALTHAASRVSTSRRVGRVSRSASHPPHAASRPPSAGKARSAAAVAIVSRTRRGTGDEIGGAGSTSQQSQLSAEHPGGLVLGLRRTTCKRGAPWQPTQMPNATRAP
eukprot:364782-Chlamydomonas_euryale.AAC.5